MTATKAIRVACLCAAGVFSGAAGAADESFGPGDVLKDTELYFTAPLRWNVQDWTLAG